MIPSTANYDEAWKEALSEYFEAFLNFFFPNVYSLIDWTQIPQSLDKELQQITASSKTSKRFADKLYQVWLQDGNTAWVLIHVEIQSQYENEFPERMYIYNYRAFDLYHQPVISLAVLGDERKNWRPTSYHYELGGCGINFDFPMVKLLDYESQMVELELNNNPFAIIVMAHLRTKATTRNPQQREQWKWMLIRGLYDRGLEREQIIKLFQIIDRMMTLPNPLQQSLNQKIEQFEEERTMPLLSNLELRGIEKGKEIGKEIGAVQNASASVKIVLNTRLGEIPVEINNALGEITDLSILEDLLKQAIIVSSFEEFNRLL